MKIGIRNGFTTAILASVLIVGATASGLARSDAIRGLVAHRAVYDIDLLKSSDRSGIRAMNGRIVYEITGSVCEGFAVSFRFVTRINTGRKSFVTDQRTTTFEDGAGKNLRFLTKSYVNDQFEKEVRGNAKRTDSGVDVSISKPESKNLQLGNAIFTTEHLARIIEKAKIGETFFTADVFDGSDSADELMATTAVIGKKSVDKPAGFDILDGKPSWPVSISYFSLKNEQRGENLPVYRVAFDLYENGISSNLKLYYKDYSLKGALRSVKLLPTTKCE